VDERIGFMTPQQPELFKVLIPTKYIALSDKKKRKLAPLQYAKVFLLIYKKGERILWKNFILLQKV